MNNDTVSSFAEGLSPRHQPVQPRGHLRLLRLLRERLFQRDERLPEQQQQQHLAGRRRWRWPLLPGRSPQLPTAAATAAAATAYFRLSSLPQPAGTAATAAASRRDEDWLPELLQLPQSDADGVTVLHAAPPAWRGGRRNQWVRWTSPPPGHHAPLPSADQELRAALPGPAGADVSLVAVIVGADGFVHQRLLLFQSSPGRSSEVV